MVESLLRLPGSESMRRLDFDTAIVRPGFIPNTWFLIVRGKAPCLNMNVRLSPLIYIRCPEYWGIEVIGSTSGPFCLTGIKPFTEVIPLDGIIGSKGIEVLGATKKKRVKVSGGCKASFSFSSGKVAKASPAAAGDATKKAKAKKAKRKA